MLGQKVKCFKAHTAVSLAQLVPQDNFYRQVEAKLDLSFVRELVKEQYAASMGRPSIDPVVFFKLQLIMFFEGFRSERQLMEQVNLNLASRWYIGYDLDEPVPNHSSLSKIRSRYGLDVFQRFFEHIVDLCIEAGLVWGQELYFDGTKVQANAALESLVPRFSVEAKQHLKRLFTSTGPEASIEPALNEDNPLMSSRGFVEKYNGTRITGPRMPWYQRTSDSQVSPTDPDATPMKRFSGDKARLGYHTHYVVDGGMARIILAVLVTPASIMDNTPMLDLARWSRFRWQLHPKIAVGDAKYGTVVNIVGLEQDGIRAYLPTADSRRGDFYSLDRFRYDAEQDVYFCPQGQRLTLHHRSPTKQHCLYRADATVCQVCPVRPECTTGKAGRSVVRSFFQDYLDRAVAYRDTAPYQKAMRKRKLWPEPLFGEAKQWHGLQRFRLRRLWRVNIEGLMVASGQNLKRLLRYRGKRSPLQPAASGVLPQPAACIPAFLGF